MNEKRSKLNLSAATTASLLLLGLGLNTRAAADDSQEIKITRSGAQAAQQAPSEHFTGSARIDPLFPVTAPSRVSAGSVTFQPGARCAWHTHPLGQTLIVTAGTGWIQRWDGPIQEMHQGDVISIPPGLKH